MPLLYFGKRFESARAGLCLVGIECDECGCEYFYELARIGSGGATAPYGIGKAAAARSSQQQSQRDLRKRLAYEAELVPCPKCNWINEELVHGYRLGRFRWVGILALGVGMIGTVSSLMGAWFISIGPAADRAAVPYLLFGGPLVFVSLGVAMILLRAWLRGRIQPNRDFPLAPRLPPGSPPALVMDEESGELKTARRRDAVQRGRSEWYDFQLGRDQLPCVCCDCLNSATPGHAYRRFVTAAIELEVPRCADCACRSKRTARCVWSIAAAVSLLVGGGVLLAMPLDSTGFWLLFGMWTLVSLAIASYAASSMTVPVEVRMVDRSRGILNLRFRNPEYHPSHVRSTEIQPRVDGN
ncbi:MAG: hypothetical protein NTW96_02680 [Planctomycetia bacterium]|nr:hypothetical protein [Planctomycetia bacterium]